MSGGLQNNASGPGAFVGGGGYDGVTVSGNTAGGAASVVAGGLGNQATNTYATVAGGVHNTAGGKYSFAAGRQAHALNQGAFVWVDSQNAPLTTIANDEFRARASGGFYFYMGTGIVGAQLNANATSWTTISDRNAKKNFKPVNTVAVLDKLAAVPIEQWNYKWEKDRDVPNLLIIA